MKTISQKIHKRRNYSDKELAELFAIDELNIKYTPPKFTDKELIELFPDAKEVVDLKIKECEFDIRKKKKEIKYKLTKLYSLKTDSFSEWYGEEIIKQFFMPELTKLEKTFFRLKHFQNLFNPEKGLPNSTDFGEKIEIAREFPIAELARSKLDLRPSGKNYRCLCPAHDDSRPSMYLYVDSNTFICFSCNNFKGDVIKLTMYLYALSFREAVEMLQN